MKWMSIHFRDGWCIILDSPIISDCLDWLFLEENLLRFPAIKLPITDILTRLLQFLMYSVHYDVSVDISRCYFILKR